MRLPGTLLAAVFLAGCASSGAPDASHVSTHVAPADAMSEEREHYAAHSGAFGLLVMAHGGDAAWNAAVESEVTELHGTLPVELAFGMANPMTLGAAVDRLAARGVERAAVVRLFLSGASFRSQTDWYLGMASSPPAHFVLMGPAGGDPAARRALDRVADAIRDQGFARVATATLREDWPEERAVEEAAIRAFVRDEAAAGRRVLVVPARLSGFGPYAEVLEGLGYAAGEGLLPHPDLSDWILRTGYELGCRRGWVGSEACER